MKKRKKIFLPIIFIILLITTYVGIYLYARILPKLSIDNAHSYYLYDNNNNLYTSTNEDWANLKNISKPVINATISIEDKNFYKHQGFDFLRIMKALTINLKNQNKAQGASTITQQYSKNLFLEFDKTWKRKFKEAWLTIRLEAHYDKNKILEGYLNTINYGGIFGIQNASKYYFDKEADELSLAEASMLAGIPKNPSTYSPITNEKNAKKRQRIVLNSMVNNGYITKQEANDAYMQKLVYKKNKDDDDLKMIMYYQDAVMEELKEIDSIPSSVLETGGIKIYTNLDVKKQKILENSITKNINNDIEVAGIIEQPTSGKVLALTGGIDYNKSQFNRAINAKRQVGSTLKPFLYYAALENGFTASSTFTSEKTTFSFSNNKTYSPKNYNDKYAQKPISMAAAIAYSDNIYAVKTHLFLGENTLPDILKRIGINKNIKTLPSLALGAEEFSLMEMMGAYTTLANEGYKIKPYFISKVTDMQGNVLYSHKEISENVLNKSNVFILNNLLTTTYAKEFIDYNYPTCININPKMTKTYAIKSGTTNTDNLIFGYNKDLLVGLWSGYDNNIPITNTDSANLKNTWIDTMEESLKEKDNNWYEMPDNVVGVPIDPISGKAINNGKAKILYYIKGTTPSEEKISLDDIVPTIKTE